MTLCNGNHDYIINLDANKLIRFFTFLSHERPPPLWRRRTLPAPLQPMPPQVEGQSEVWNLISYTQALPELHRWCTNIPKVDEARYRTDLRVNRISWRAIRHFVGAARGAPQPSVAQYRIILWSSQSIFLA